MNENFHVTCSCTRVCVCVCVCVSERERDNVVEHGNTCTKTCLIFVFFNLTVILKFMKSVPYVV
jgi:hypothetical protein